MEMNGIEIPKYQKCSVCMITRDIEAELLACAAAIREDNDRFMRLAAGSVGQLLNSSRPANDCGVDQRSPAARTVAAGGAGFYSMRGMAQTAWSLLMPSSASVTLSLR
jgi:hypothetical protein